MLSSIATGSHWSQTLLALKIGAWPKGEWVTRPADGTFAGSLWIAR
jgi:hypothetical protein